MIPDLKFVKERELSADEITGLNGFLYKYNRFAIADEACFGGIAMRAVFDSAMYRNSIISLSHNKEEYSREYVLLSPIDTVEMGKAHLYDDGGTPTLRITCNRDGARPVFLIMCFE